MMPVIMVIHVAMVVVVGVVLLGTIPIVLLLFALVI